MTELLPEPPFIVLRPARGLPPGFLPADHDGRWYNRAELFGDGPVVSQHVGMAIAIPTDRIEHRDSDGATAQVWEVHPRAGNYANTGDPGDRSG